ncbi:CaiB/BaiF CoA transferase family protein [Azospirillum canadense]|uniref:CaiB/BaiF CoA transferase family protein n=1 Tax=Azospirillum canadense TaxID=403962 RepID=UPI0022271A7B|nr:CaiB/BaiF CoA-transferase family protein [Azospirillum canadense]MCW2241370.1 crotonobetainyl-CoA:carnitine CoA-transferase CaiB-like acyl-CoA transferase [Azospirillum canadense]
MTLHDARTTTAEDRSTAVPNTTGPTGPLKGVRVLDLTRLLPGAYCTQMLADLGADVIKIEQPGRGDYWRWSPPAVRTHGAQFLALNRGKRSITLDLKTDGGREALLRLCATADVLIEGFRPGVMGRLGLIPEVLHARNPKLVICALTGFGQDGPWAQVAAHDLNYVGMTGLLQLVNGRSAAPRATGLPIGDIGAGALMAIGGILAALVDARGSGRGRFVDVSVADGLYSWIGFMTACWNVPGMETVDVPFDAPFDKPFYSVYETADGRHLVVGAYEEKFWQALCAALDLPEWLDRQWCEGEEEDRMRAAIAAALKRKTLDEWLAVFAEREACVTPVLTTREALQSPHAKARGAVVTVDDPVEGRLHHVGNPLRFDGHAFNALAPVPRLGADGEALLREAGYTAADIEDLRTTGAM